MALNGVVALSGRRVVDEVLKVAFEDAQGCARATELQGAKLTPGDLPPHGDLVETETSGRFLHGQPSGFLNESRHNGLEQNQSFASLPDHNDELTTGRGGKVKFSDPESVIPFGGPPSAGRRRSEGKGRHGFARAFRPERYDPYWDMKRITDSECLLNR